MSVKVKKFCFESKFDAVPISGICMIPDNPSGILEMVHGMCEHKSRYLSFMQNMAERGYITLMHDTRGHGESVKSKEDIGHCYDSLEVGMVGDIYKISQQIKKEYPRLPLILYGHSMGSLAARVYIRNHDDMIDGLIIAGSPSYNELVPVGLKIVNRLRKRHGERYRSALMQEIAISRFENRFKHENRKYSWLSSKDSVLKALREDELCNFVYTLNGFEALLNMEYITYRAGGYRVGHVDLPILFMSGMDDPCYVNENKWRQSVDRMKELGYQNVREIRYAGMRHEIQNENGNDKVFDDVDCFCKEVIYGVENR